MTPDPNLTPEEREAMDAAMKEAYGPMAFQFGWLSARDFFLSRTTQSEPYGDEREWIITNALGREIITGPQVGEENVVPKSRLIAAEKDRDAWRQDAEDFSAVDALQAFQDRAEKAEARIRELEAGSERIARTIERDGYPSAWAAAIAEAARKTLGRELESEPSEAEDRKR